MGFTSLVWQAGVWIGSAHDAYRCRWQTGSIRSFCFGRYSNMSPAPAAELFPTLVTDLSSRKAMAISPPIPPGFQPVTRVSVGFPSHRRKTVTAILRFCDIFSSGIAKHCPESEDNLIYIWRQHEDVVPTSFRAKLFRAFRSALKQAR